MQAANLISIDAAGFIGFTGLCPGAIALEDGSKTLAYRFIDLTESDAIQLMDQLDKIIHDLRKAD